MIPYFPGDGNGGYDVAHYHLDVTYDPATGELRVSRTSRRPRRRTCHGSTSTSRAWKSDPSQWTALAGRRGPGRPGRLGAGGRRTDRHTIRWGAGRGNVLHTCGVRRNTGHQHRNRRRVRPHPGWGRGHGRTARRGNVVPGERSSQRQGHLRHCRSPCPPGWRRCPTVPWSAAAPPAGGRPGSGAPTNRWPPT